MEVAINWEIPVWGLIVSIVTVLGLIIKVYYNFVWLEKKFNFWQNDYILFKTDTQTDIEKCEQDIIKQSGFNGIDPVKLSNAVERLVESQTSLNLAIGLLTKDVQVMAKDLEDLKIKTKNEKDY